MEQPNFQQYMIDLLPKILKDQASFVDEVFETSLRHIAEPPITGDITKGKLRWRGIRMCTQDRADGNPPDIWLEQRGNPISPRIEFDYSLGRHRG